jgi:hypothetical protein
MCYDMAHVVAVYPRLGGTATCFHHASFAAAALVAGVSRSCPFAFGWCAPRVLRGCLRGSHACTAPRLTLCEVSTPFLNLRWVFKCVSYADVARCAALTPAP